MAEASHAGDDGVDGRSTARVILFGFLQLALHY